jgi:signal transduction histidine kinase
MYGLVLGHYNSFYNNRDGEIASMKNTSNEKSVEPTEDFSLVLASSIHDIKNSVSLLLGSLSTMIAEYPPINTRQVEHYSLLEYEAARINDELVQLLWLYRMDKRELRLAIDEHQILDTLEQQLARNNPLLVAKGIAVSLDIPPDLLWWYDAELIGSVINNLVLNATRFCRHVLHIQAKKDNNFLCVRLIDDGPGFPTHLLSRNKTVKETDALTFNPQGARLGLAFARKVLALHETNENRGYITIENQNTLGGGIISLFLP